MENNLSQPDFQQGLQEFKDRKEKPLNLNSEAILSGDLDQDLAQFAANIQPSVEYFSEIARTVLAQYFEEDLAAAWGKLKGLGCTKIVLKEGVFHFMAGETELNTVQLSRAPDIPVLPSESQFFRQRRTEVFQNARKAWTDLLNDINHPNV